MTKAMLFRLVLVGMTMLVIQRANAASAVAMEIDHANLITSRGQTTIEIAMQHALATAHQRYGANVRLVAASNIDGYCAIAIARKGNGSVIGVALGKRSATEAYAMAIEKCLKAGGIDPKVRWAWYG
jgi:hypothetical protein